MNDDTRENLPVVRINDRDDVLPLDDTPGYVTPTEREGRSRGCTWGLFGCFGCALLLIVPVAALVLMGSLSVGTITGAMQGLFGFINPTPFARVDMSQTLVLEIRRIGELNTFQTQLAKSDVTVNVWQGTIGSCSFTAAHRADATITAGIDLAQIDEEDIRYDAARNTFIVRLPSPALTSCTVDVVRYDERIPIVCRADWEAVRMLADYEATRAMRDEAVEGGILEQAAIEGEILLQGILGSLAGQFEARVEIEFTEPETRVDDSTCSPPAPDGWLQDEGGTWYRPAR